MTLESLIKYPQKNIILSYYTQKNTHSLKEKLNSDMHLSMFTDMGREESREVLSLEIESIEGNTVYLKSDDDNKSYWEKKINDFWDFMTRFGAYRWNMQDYPDILATSDWHSYVSHSSFFEFTSELVHPQINS